VAGVLGLSIFLYCRAGFEGECAAEIQEKAAASGVFGYCKAKPDSAYVVFVTPSLEEAQRLHQLLRLDELIFARQWFVVLGMRNDLSMDDRLSPLLAELSELPGPVTAFEVETPDTNEAKELSGLCRSISHPLRAALKQSGQLADDGRLRLHLCFMSTRAAYIGYSLLDNSSSWRMGIPRLKSPRQAPSRSTLKLEEAFLSFLSDEEQERYLRSDMVGVDLGACPGGWTWQLLQRGLHVIAIDNGPMAEVVMETNRVTHLQVDGYTYQPDSPVDWMVCDIVETPIRTADMAARWLAQGWCRYTIFNLKLPMKKRWQEVQRCLALIDEQLQAAGLRYVCKAKQLYHDREEVTVYIRLLR